MPFPLAIPLLSLVGGLLSSVVGAGVSHVLSKDTMEDQAKINQQGIDTANRYNEPINQMSRLRQAGLNPNLVYGNGTVAGLTSQGAASTNQGFKNVPFNLGVSDAVGSYYQGKQIDQNISESRSRQELLTQQVRESMAKEFMYMRSGLKDDAELPYIADLIKSRIRNYDANSELATSTSALRVIERANAAELTKYYAARTGLTQEQAKTEIKRQFVMQMQARLYGSNINLNNKQIEYLGEKILNLQQDTKNKELWHTIQDAEFQSSGALKDWLKDHENWAIIYAIFHEIFNGVGVGISYKP